MTAQRDIKTMVPLFGDKVTAIASIGCYTPALPQELFYNNWVFPDVEFTWKTYEVLEKLEGGVEDYPYIAVLGFRTIYSIN